MTNTGTTAARHINLLLKWRLLQAIVADADLSEPAKIIAVRLLDRTNTETGLCWPSYARLAAEVGYRSRLTAKRAVKELERRGWLNVEYSSSAHVGSTNRFRPIFERIPAHPGSGESTGSGGTGEVDLTASPPGGSSQSPKLDRRETQKEKLGNSITRSTARSPADEPAGFDEFWVAYPKRKDKGRAKKLYAQTIRKGLVTSAQLLAGAQRYAAERHGQDAQFTKGPVNWLAGECWTDEPSTCITPAGAWMRRSKPSALQIAAQAVGVVLER